MVLTPLKSVAKFEEQDIKLDYKAKSKDGIQNDLLDETKDIAVGSGLTSEYTTSTQESQPAKNRKASSKKQNDKTSTYWRKMPLTRDITILQVHEQSLQLVETNDKGSPRNWLRRMSEEEIKQASW